MSVCLSLLIPPEINPLNNQKTYLQAPTTSKSVIAEKRKNEIIKVSMILFCVRAVKFVNFTRIQKLRPDHEIWKQIVTRTTEINMEI